MTTPVKWDSELTVNTTRLTSQSPNPLGHYWDLGWREGRDPSVGFDALKYLAGNPDVAAAHVNPLEHFLLSGVCEGRAVINGGWL
jgi:hypothetical protein